MTLTHQSIYGVSAMGTWNLDIGSELGERRMLTDGGGGTRRRISPGLGETISCEFTLPEFMETFPGGKQFGVASRYFWWLIGALAFGQ